MAVRLSYAWPPRAMPEEMAAHYLSLSPSLFRAEVARGGIPKPIQLTIGRKAWLRDDLDGYLDRLAGRAATSSDSGDEWMKALKQDGTGGPHVR